MRKNITIVILIGVLSWIPIVSQAQHHDDDDDNGNRSIHTVQGKVVDFNHDGVWDYVTFGLVAPRSYCVSFIELVDETGIFGIVDDLDYPHREGISWFQISLREFKKSGNFSLRIHVVTGSNSGGSTIMLSSLSKIGRSIVPDETVVIIKYP